MKRIIVSIAIMAAVLFPLGGCTLPGVGPVDPINPVIPVDPPSAPITAAFDYYSVDYPIQTGSLVIFNGGDSSSPNGEIVWGEWTFGDEEDEAGNWTMLGSWVYENGERKWVTIPWTGTEMVWHIYDDPGHYSVELTVWDAEGNHSTTWRRVLVEERQ